jgi:hypothetical protein
MPLNQFQRAMLITGFMAALMRHLKTHPHHLQSNVDVRQARIVYAKMRSLRPPDTSLLTMAGLFTNQNGETTIELQVKKRT